MLPNYLTTIYVSQKHGKKRFCGYEKDAPADSLETALNSVAELRKFGILQPITIEILDDFYYVGKTIKIDGNISPKLSGIVSSVTVKGHNTVISGGRKIDNWVEDELNGVKCVSAYIPEIKDGFWFTDLYVNDKRADVTYYPHDRLLRPKEVENNSTDLRASSKWFIAADEDIDFLSKIHNLGDCVLSYNHYWTDEHTPIESYDLNSGKIVMAYGSRYTIEPTHPASALEYRLENVSEMFMNENEWYLDRTTSKVYYIPTSDIKDISEIDAYAPTVKTLFEVCGTPENKIHSVTFENIIFAHTKGDYASTDIDEYGNISKYAADGQSVHKGNGTIEFRYAQNCAVKNCTVKSFGVHAIVIEKGCSDISVYGNTVFNGGAGGIRVNGGEYGSDESEHTHHINISQNKIFTLGRHYLAGCGVLLMHAYCCNVSHNDISDLYYTGISCGWVWGYKDSISHDNIISKNHIYNIGQGKLSDMGGIYLLGPQRGTVISGNIVHNVKSKHYGGWGIYTDEGSSYMLAENNICYDTTCDAYHQHFGCMNTLRNNIFIGGHDFVLKQSKDENHIGLLLENNILVSTSGAVYRTGYDEQSDFYHLICGHDNLFWSINQENPVIYTTENGDYDLAAVQNELGFEKGSFVADPQFKDFDNCDFSLKESSPAFALGFKQIRTDDVGITL